MPKAESEKAWKTSVLLTGPSGAGKSSLARALVKRGWRHLDGDQLAKSLYRPGSRLLTSVVKAFGKSVLQDDGRLDAVRLGEIVFPSLAQRRRLNRLVYPAFIRALKLALKRGRGPWVADVAVYFDAGTPELGLPVILVTAPIATRVKRLRDAGVPAARAAARARSLRFGPRERAQASLTVDGRRPVAQNAARIIRFLGS